MKDQIIAVIMAAGEGTRMKSKHSKVMHKICGRPIIKYVIEAVKEVSSKSPVIIAGHMHEEIEDFLGNEVEYAYQTERLGTGHAVMMARKHLENFEGYAIVLAGDTPLIRGETLNKMVEYARDGQYAAVALSTMVDNPYGYGRIVRDENLEFSRIVEHRDATTEELKIQEINASMYCFKTQDLLKGLDRIENNNSQGEYYLTDVLEIIKGDGKKIGVYCVPYPDQIRGINTRKQLSECEALMRQRINEYHMDNGVTIIDPTNTYIEPDVVIERDVVIYPGNSLEGNTVIEEDCVLYPNNRVRDSRIMKGSKIQSSFIVESKVGQKTTVGPYAYIRPGT